MLPTRQDTEHHRCNIVGESWDLLPQYIESGLMVNFRRSLKRITMITKRHPLTIYYAPSLPTIKEEMRRHLELHYRMIHPHSILAFYYKMITAIVFLGYFIALPYFTPFVNTHMLMNLILGPLNLLQIILIIMSFNMGYYDKAKNTVVLNRRRVIKNYFRTYFFFDILPLWRHGLFLFHIEQSYDWIFLIISPISVVSRYVRYFWCLKVLEDVRIFYGISTFMCKAIKLVLNMITSLSLSIYILYSIMDYLPNIEVAAFSEHAMATLQMMMLVNIGHRIRERETLEIMIPILFITVGFIFHLIVITETMDVWFQYTSAETQQDVVFESISAYMRYKALPVKLRQRIHLYLEFKYQGQFYKESAVRDATSSYLRKEILLVATQNSIQKVDLFQSIPLYVLKKVRASLVSEIFLPGDSIIKAGYRGRCMFFLLCGTVVVTSPDEKVICYLRDGSHFGEVALLINIARVANVTAVTPCELFRLDRRSFWEVMKQYPKVWNDIKSMTVERIPAYALSQLDLGSRIPSTYL